MVSFFVVFEHPCPGNFTFLIEIPEQPSAQHFGSIRTIEAFDKRILIRFTGLDVVEHDAVFFTPTDKDFAQKFGPIVGSQNIRQTALLLDPMLAQGTDMCGPTPVCNKLTR